MISVTDLSSYLYCPRKLYLAKVLGFKEVPKEVVVKGNVRHLAHDLASKAEARLISSIMKVDRSLIYEVFSKNYGFFLRDSIKVFLKQLEEVDLSPMDVFDCFWSGFKAEAELRASQVYAFAKSSGLVGQELWGSIVPKVQSELWIESSSLQLRGVIDRIEVFDDFVVPVEIKTGSCPNEGVWPSHQIQVAAYLVLLKDKGRPVREAYVYYVDRGVKRVIVLNPFLEDKIFGLIKEVNYLLSSDKMPPVCDNSNKCKSCGLKDRCL